MTIRRLFVLVPFTLLAIGCGSDGPVTHPVKGQVQLAGGDPAALAGHSLEVALRSDPTVRAYAEIQPDGTFTLESLHAGQIKRGALAGQYVARLVLADDDPQLRLRAAAAVDPRLLSFQTSDWQIEVPADENITLPVKRR